MMAITPGGGLARLGQVTIVGPGDLVPGDEVVGIQRRGETDELRRLRDRIIQVGTGEHPQVGGECIQFSPVMNGHEFNYWRGSEYFDDSLFHVIRRSNSSDGESLRPIGDS